MNIAKNILSVFEEQICEIYNSKMPRLEQTQMALDVADFLYNSSKKTMFVEAPVGVGKTLGVLIPALINQMENTNKITGITYATATISLQNQIMTEEVPNICQIKPTILKMEKPDRLRAFLAMGSEHSLCRAQFEKNYKKIEQKVDSQKIKILNDFVKNSHTGLRSELSSVYGLDINNDVWKLMNIKSRYCHDLLCRGHEYRKKYSREFALTVTNHSQFIVSAKNIFDDNPFDEMHVPVANRIIVIDEAHDFQENFLSSLEEQLTLDEVKHAAEHINRRLMNAICTSFKVLKNNSNSEKSVSMLKDSDILFTQFRQLKSKIMDEEIENNAFKYGYRYGRYDELLVKINNILKSEEYTVWYSAEDQNIHYAPKNFKQRLQLFLKKLAAHNKVVIMSGTLTMNGNKKELSKDWYMKSNEFEYKEYSTTFDWSKQIYFYAPHDISAKTGNDLKKQNDHISKIINLFQNTLFEIPGGALILTTSLNYMNNVYESLSKKNLNRRLIKQGQFSQGKIIETFKQDITSILVGSGSYFTGFSVKGEALQNVLLTKLPNPTPDNPFFKLKLEGINEGLEKNNVKNLIMYKKLEQAIGRLIRDQNDFGLFTITDDRIMQHETWLSSKKIIIHPSLDQLPKFLTDWKNKKVELNMQLFSEKDLHIPEITKTKSSFVINPKPINYVKKAPYDVEKVKNRYKLLKTMPKFDETYVPNFQTEFDSAKSVAYQYKKMNKKMDENFWKKFPNISSQEKINIKNEITIIVSN